MKKYLLILLVLVLVLSMAACASPQPAVQPPAQPAGDAPAAAGDAPPAAADDREFTVVFMPKSLDNVVYNGLRDSVLERGPQIGINVEWTGPVTSNSVEQVNMIETLIERGVDAIAVAVDDASMVEDVFRRAREAGIIVATFDSDAENSARQFYVGTDNVELGRIAGQQMLRFLSEGDEVAIMIATPGMVNIQERVDGFVEVTEPAGITVRAIIDCDTNTAIAVDRANQFVAANPDLDGFFFTHGLTHYASPAALAEYMQWRSAGGVSVAIDAVYPMFAFFHGDEADFVLIDQAWDEMGVRTLDIIAQMLRGEDPGLPSDNIVHTGTFVIDRSNWRDIYATLDPW